MIKIHPRFATARFRHACGLPRCTMLKLFAIGSKRILSAPVLDIDLHKEPFIVFDFSYAVLLLAAMPSENAAPQLTRRILQERNSANVLESDDTMSRATSIHQKFLHPFTRRWNAYIHLGMDLFAEAGTPVYAPIAGNVQAFANNASPQDYGPMVILKHHTNDGQSFYVYGHLSVESLARFSVGKKIATGEQLGTIGAQDVNGGWPTHLHLQIILDPLELDCDFPGVVRASQREVWSPFRPIQI